MSSNQSHVSKNIEQEINNYEGLSQLFAGLKLGKALLSHPTSRGTLHHNLPVSAKRIPQQGNLLCEQFLNNPDLQPGIRYQLRQFLSTIKSSYVPHDKKLFRKVWKNFIAIEHKAYEQIPDSTPFQVKTSDGLQDIGPCRPSGKPESILHIILDHATLEPGSFSHVKSRPLDSGNCSVHPFNLGVGGKGFTPKNSFLFDSFPRRCHFEPTPPCPSARDKWPIFREAHDWLHEYWRSRGGKIILLLGDNAERAYNDMIRRDINLFKEKISTTEAFEVWIERLRTKDRQMHINRIVVKVLHPSSLFNKPLSRNALVLDNGCNFAAALAGICDLLDPYFFSVEVSKIKSSGET